MLLHQLVNRISLVRQHQRLARSRKKFIHLFVLSVIQVVCILLQLGVPLAAYSQNLPFSQSEEKHEQAADTAQVDRLNQLAKVYQWKSPEQSKSYARQAYIMASRLHYVKGASYALWKLGTIHELQGNYNKALYYFFESIRIRPPGENTVAKAHAFGSIANLYISLAQYKQAETYLNESFSIFKKASHRLGIGISHRRLGYLQLSQHQLQPAMYNFSRSLAIMQQLQDSVGIGYARAFIGQVYFHQKKYRKALEEYLAAVTLQDTLGNYAEKAYLLSYIGKIYTQTGDFTKAAESYQQAIQLSKALNFKPALQENYQSLASLYKAEGNLKEALSYYEQFLALHDELLSTETVENIADLQIQYQSFEKEQQIELLKKEKEIQALNITKSTHLMYFFLAILLLMLMVCALLYSRYRLKKKANLALQKQNEEISQQNNKIEHQNNLLQESKKVIEDQNQLLATDKMQLEDKVREKTTALMDAYSHLLQANEELDILVYKSSHDLRGPLATILGICNIAFMDSKEEAALNYFKLLSKNATRMDAILHRLLKVNHVKHAEVHSLLLQPEQLITEVLDTMVTTEGYTDMHFNIDIEPGIFFRSDADLIKTVLENLLQNAINYRSFIPGKSPSVWLQVNRLGGVLRIIVKDNGIGIEKEYASKIFSLFSKGTLRSKGSGLGLYIAKAAVSKINGSIRYCSELTDLTTFEVIIPDLDGKSVLHPLQKITQPQ